MPVEADQLGKIRTLLGRSSWVIQMDESREVVFVSLTILYRNPERPDEAGMIITDQAKAAAMIDQLEERGFVVDKITFGPSSKSAQAD